MSTTSAPKIRVWDAPTRVFHWLTVLSFSGAYLSAESERWRLIHITLGYTLGALLVFRMVWGVVGTRYARFGNFVRGPVAVARYLAGLLRAKPQHYFGHNPAGAVAIVLMLVLGALLVGSGWATYNDVGGNAMSDWHALLGNALLALVAVHLVGVVTASWQHRENLVRAMLTGHKSAAKNGAVGAEDEDSASEDGASEAGIRRSWNGLAIAMLLAVLAFWFYQWFAPV